MNLARFGVAIDPTPAQAGARATIAAARSIRPALEDVARTATTAGAAQTGMGRAGEAAGGRVGRGMRQAATETRNAGRAAKEASTGFEAMVGKIMNVVKALAAAYAAMQLVRGAFSLLGNAIDKASQMEGFRTRWAYLLGSFDAAKAKMADLFQFANDTPFELPGVTQAALSLQNLKDTGLETMAGLKQVGDAAARAQQPIEEVASRITRLVNNLKRGGGSGDEARILGEWQILSPAAVATLAEAGTDATKFADNLKLVKAELDNSKNAMLLMSTTWQGVTSNLKGAWDRVFTTLGEPIINGLKPAILELTKFVDGISGQITTWQPAIEAFAAKVSAAVKVLNTDGGLQLTLEAAADSFKVYFNRAVIAGTDLLMQKLPAIGNALWDIMKRVGEYFVKAVLDGLMGILPAAAESLTKGMRTALTGAQTFYAKHLASIGAGTGMIDEADLPDIQKGIENKGAADLAKQQAKISGYFSYYDNLGGGPRGELFPGGDTSSLDQITARAEKLAPATEKMKKWSEAMDRAIAQQAADKELQQQNNDNLVGNAAATKKAAEAAAAAAGPVASKGGGGGGGGSVKDPMAEYRTEAARIIEATRTPDEVFQQTVENLDKLRKMRLLDESQYQRALAKSQKEYADSVEQQAAATQAAIERQMTPLQKLGAQWGNLQKNVGEAMAAITQSLSDNVSQGLTSMIDGTKSAKEAFADMAKGIVDSIIKIVVQLAVQYALSAALGQAGPVQAVNLGGLTAAVKHDGGHVGTGGGTSRALPAAVFAGAQRFHSGGVIGANEVPIVAEKGESVITKAQSDDIKDRLRGGGQKKQQESTATIINVMDMRMLDAHLMKNPGAILNPMRQNSQTVKRIINGNS